MKTLKERPIYFLDIETTGLSPTKDEIIEICIIKQAAKGDKSQAPPRVYFHTKLHPDIRVSEEAKKVNGYTIDKWKNAVPQEEGLRKAIDFIDEKGFFCGHNVDFDMSFLKNSLIRHGMYGSFHKLKSLGGHRTLDTYTLAYEHLVPQGLTSLSMDSIREFLDWDRDEFHSAMKDASDVQELFNLLALKGSSYG